MSIDYRNVGEKVFFPTSWTNELDLIYISGDNNWDIHYQIKHLTVIFIFLYDSFLLIPGEIMHFYISHYFVMIHYYYQLYHKNVLKLSKINPFKHFYWIVSGHVNCVQCSYHPHCSRDDDVMSREVALYHGRVRYSGTSFGCFYDPKKPEITVMYITFTKLSIFHR